MTIHTCKHKYKKGDFVIDANSGKMLKISSGIDEDSYQVSCQDIDGNNITFEEKDLKFATQDDVAACKRDKGWKNKSWANQAYNWLISHNHSCIDMIEINRNLKGRI